MSNSTPRTALPPLPPPAVKAGDYAGPPGEGASENYWDAEQVEQIRRETVQACYHVATSDDFYGSPVQVQIADAILALLPVKEPKE